MISLLLHFPISHSIFIALCELNGLYNDRIRCRDTLELWVTSVRAPSGIFTFKIHNKLHFEISLLLYFPLVVSHSVFLALYELNGLYNERIRCRKVLTLEIYVAPCGSSLLSDLFHQVATETKFNRYETHVTRLETFLLEETVLTK